MNPFRKFFGFFIIAFIAIPVLFVTIIAVGVTNSVVTPEFLSELPRDVIEELPVITDQLYSELEKEEYINDERTRVLINAMKKIDKTPRQLMEEVGIFFWLKNELGESLKKFGEVLRGERPPEPLHLNMSTLKKALTHNSVTQYFKAIINQLPECDNIDIEEWKDTVFKSKWSDDFDLGSFPLCRPANLEITDELVKTFQLKAIEDIQDRVDLIDNEDYCPSSFNITKVVSTVTYALFLLPLILIVLGSLVGATSMPGFFKWSGISIMIGGLSAYGLASLLENLIPVSKFGFKFHHTEFISSNFNELIYSKAANLTDMFLDKLFTPASKLGGTVAVIGLIIFAVSFLINEKRSD
ncbi:MAG: hypothetical protein ABFR75_10705 [Acidobacteriota bacterium]